jgi:predicted ATPase
MKEDDTAPRKMLKDGISFDLDRQAEKDAFSHSTYADVILRILTAEENEPPLTIGLFGPWGIGKSFVVRELFDKIKGRQTPFRRCREFGRRITDSLCVDKSTRRTAFLCACVSPRVERRESCRLHGRLTDGHFPGVNAQPPPVS